MAVSTCDSTTTPSNRLGVPWVRLLAELVPLDATSDAQLQSNNRADYVAVDPNIGAVGAGLNGCNDPDVGSSPKQYRVAIAHSRLYGDHVWAIRVANNVPIDLVKWCFRSNYKEEIFQDKESSDSKYPETITSFEVYGHECSYTGCEDRLGRLICDGVDGIHCYDDPQIGQ